MSQSSATSPSLAVFNNHLWLAFIGETSNHLHLCSSPDGMNWGPTTSLWANYAGGAAVQAQSSNAPALLNVNSQLNAFWTADSNSSPFSTNELLNACSDDGNAWDVIPVGSSPAYPPQHSKSAPSPCYAHGWYLAYIGINSGDVLVCGQTLNTAEGMYWWNATPWQTGQSSQCAPSLAPYQPVTAPDQLWIAFIGETSKHVLVCSSPDGMNWGPATNVGQSSQCAPSLAVFNSQLRLAFIGKTSKHVLVCSSPDGVNWGPTTNVGQSSQCAPSLAVFNNQLWLAFIGETSKHVLVCSSPDGVNWPSTTYGPP